MPQWVLKKNLLSVVTLTISTFLLTSGKFIRPALRTPEGHPLAKIFTGQIWHQVCPPRSEVDSMPGINGVIKHNQGKYRNGSTVSAFNSFLWITEYFLSGYLSP